jgi:alpha-galactosidase
MSCRPRPISRRAFLQSVATYGAAGLSAAAVRRPRVALSASPARARQPAASAARRADNPYNGCGLTPAWGLNTYYGYGLDGYDEGILFDAAQAIRDSGLWQAGYRMLGIDDGWSTMERDADGNLVADPRKFPAGIGATVERLHELAFSVGIYGDMGSQTCSGRPGSYLHEAADARWFAAQGFDYIKMDWCTAETFNAQERYTVMSQAILDTGQPITFSVCNWGRQEPWQWAPPIANSARTSSDLSGIYDGDYVPESYGSYQWTCMLKNVEGNQHPEAAGPGYANDPDCLQVGNGFFDSPREESAQLHLWAVMGAPMLLGLDVRSMTADTLRLLTHPILRTINQDGAALQGTRIKGEHGSEVWVKPLSDGRSSAVVLFNRTDTPTTASVSWKDLSQSPSAFVRDLWTGTEIGTLRGGYNVRLQPHESLLLQVVPLP